MYVYMFISLVQSCLVGSSVHVTLELRSAWLLVARIHGVTGVCRISGNYFSMCEMQKFQTHIIGPPPPSPHPPPPTPFIGGGGARTFQKLRHLRGGRRGGGVRNFLLETGDKLEKAGLPLFYYFTIQSHLLCMWEK